MNDSINDSDDIDALHARLSALDTDAYDRAACERYAQSIAAIRRLKQKRRA